MSLVKFTSDVISIIFPGIKILWNEATLDRIGFPLVILVVCKDFLKLSQIHIFFYHIDNYFHALGSVISKHFLSCPHFMDS